MVYKTVHYKDVDGYEQWYECDDKGNMIHIRESNGFEKWYEYDDKGKVIHSKDSNGYEQRNKFDDKGNQIHFVNSDEYEEWQKYDKNGNLIYYENSNGLKKWHERDDKGNEIHYRDSDGYEIRKEYNEKGNLIYVRHSNGLEQWHEYDNNNNQIYYKDSNGLEEWNVYNAKGNRIYSKNSDGYEQWFEYDKDGNEIYYRNSDGYERWTKYNEKGEMIYEKNSKGLEKWHEYDDKGNKTRVITNKGGRSYWEYGEREVTRELTDADISMLHKLEHDTLYFEKWFDGSSIRDEIRYQYGADLKAEANDAKKPGVSKEQKREAKPDGLHYVLGLEDVAVLRDLEMVREHFGEDFDSYFRKYECNFIDNCTYNGKNIGDRKGFDDIISGKADEVKVSYPVEYEGKKVFGMDDWTGSFHEQFKPGDLVNVEIVTEMRDCVPPVSHSPVYVQCGEPYSHKMNKDGKMAPTFATFESVSNNIHDADSVWRYCGTCFEGEHQEAKDCREEKRKVADKISDVLKDMEGKKSLSKVKSRSCGMEM